MLMSIFMLLITIFLVGLYSFCVKSFHLLNMLLSLEFMSLIIFFMFLTVFWSYTEKYILMYYLTFCVCEGAFGLSLLVALIRSVGNDYLQNLVFLKC